MGSCVPGADLQHRFIESSDLLLSLMLLFPGEADECMGVA